jgi:putative MATE family efflux protein
VSQETSGLWTDLKAAVSGKEHDYTSGNLSRAVLLLAIPMCLEMCMESLFAIVNMFWVARLGPDAITAVGLTESVETLVYAVAIGSCMGVTAMVSRRIGENDPEKAALAAGQAILIGLVASVLIAVPGVVYAPDILRFMGGEPGVVATGTGFIRTIQAGTVFILGLFLLNGVFRGAGDAMIAMRVLWIGNAVNIVLDPFLIFGWGPFPELGVTGAGIATVIGRGVAVTIQIYTLFGKQGRVRVEWRHIRPQWHVLRNLTRLSSTGMLQYLIATASWVGIVRLIAGFGTTVVAGNTVAVRIIMFTILPSWGISNAAATLVGQNLGARKPERAERAVWRIGLYNSIFLGGLGLALFAVPRLLVGWFTTDAAVVAAGAEALRVYSVGYLAYALGMVLTQAFNGAGDTLTPTLINVGCLWVFELPLAWFLSHRAGFAESGVFWSVPMADALVTAVSLWIFRRGRWKLQKV